MTKDEKTKLFFFEEHPLMILGVEALVKKANDLELCGHSSDHEALIEELTATQPAALILDLSLYSKESVEFISKIRKNLPQLKIVLLSVHTNPEYVSKAQKAGADAYVLKTEEPERIIDAVRATLAGETYVSKRIRQPGEEKAQPIDSPINLLSKQEFQILQGIGKGQTNRQIAEELQLPLKTVEGETCAIQEKLDLSSPLELLQFAFHWVHHEGGFS